MESNNGRRFVSSFLLSMIVAVFGIQGLAFGQTETSSKTSVTQDIQSLKPPSDPSIKWIRVSYQKAEDEVLALLQKDLAHIEKVSTKVAVYQIKMNHLIPVHHKITLRSKIERILLSSEKITLKECTECEKAVIQQNSQGQLQYETLASRKDGATVANDVGAEQLINVSLEYSPEILALNIRISDPQDGEILLTRTYTTQNVIQNDGSNSSFGDGIGRDDSLQEVVIGQIAFAVSLGFGFSFLPTTDLGAGTRLVGYPGIELFLGERFNRSHSLFGFFLKGYAAISSETDRDDDGNVRHQLPFVASFGTRYRYTFNPYTTTRPRWGVRMEGGMMLSAGVTTGYLGVGPEVGLIRRFSVAVMPMYIIKTTVKTLPAIATNLAGQTKNFEGQSIGKFGGFGVGLNVNLNW